MTHASDHVTLRRTARWLLWLPGVLLLVWGLVDARFRDARGAPAGGIG